MVQFFLPDPKCTPAHRGALGCVRPQAGRTGLLCVCMQGRWGGGEGLLAIGRPQA